MSFKFINPFTLIFSTISILLITGTAVKGQTSGDIQQCIINYCNPYSVDFEYLTNEQRICSLCCQLNGVPYCADTTPPDNTGSDNTSFCYDVWKMCNRNCRMFSDVSSPTCFDDCQNDLNSCIR